MQRITIELFNSKMNAAIEAFRGVTQPGGSSPYWSGVFRNAEEELREIVSVVKVNWPENLYMHFNNMHKWYRDNTEVIENRIKYSTLFYTPPEKKKIPRVFDTVEELLASYK